MWSGFFRCLFEWSSILWLCSFLHVDFSFCFCLCFFFAVWALLLHKLCVCLSTDYYDRFAACAVVVMAMVVVFSLWISFFSADFICCDSIWFYNINFKFAQDFSFLRVLYVLCNKSSLCIRLAPQRIHDQLGERLYKSWFVQWWWWCIRLDTLFNLL